MSGKNATPYSNQKNWSNTYLTDPAVLKVLGPFQTDPCCPPKMPWRTATYMYAHERPHPRSKVLISHRDGLNSKWHGRVFMNPPYRGVLKWAERFVDNGYGIALLNGRATETQATQLIMGRSAAIWFPDRRLTFYKVTGKPFTQKWFPSLLIGLTEYDAVRLERAQKKFGGTIYRREPRRE